jgi:hypothetical protein
MRPQALQSTKYNPRYQASGRHRAHTNAQDLDLEMAADPHTSVLWVWRMHAGLITRRPIRSQFLRACCRFAAQPVDCMTANPESATLDRRAVPTGRRASLPWELSPQIPMVFFRCPWHSFLPSPGLSGDDDVRDGVAQLGRSGVSRSIPTKDKTGYDHCLDSQLC